MPFISMFNHPFLFAAVAVFAIGVVVYELIEENKRRQPGGRPPPPGNPPRPPPPSFRPRPPPGDRKGPPPSNCPRPSPGDGKGPPPSDPSEAAPDDYKKSPDSSKSPSDNYLRRRNIKKSFSKENASEKFEESENLTKTSSTAGSQNSPDKKFDETNYCQNMLHKLTNDTKRVNDNVKGEDLGHNIYEEESDSSENNLLLKSEEKVINQAKNNENICSPKKPYKRKRKTKYNVEKSAKNHIDKKHNCCDSSDHYESDSQSDKSVISSSVKVTKASPIQHRLASKNTHDQSSKSPSSNLYPKLDFHSLSNSGSELIESSLSSDEAEDTYKKDMLKALKNDLQNCEIIYDTNNSAACSSKDIEKEEPSESKLCKGCEENHVNTRAYPCNHAYLCVDCAVKVSRLCKKCTICLQVIEEFVQFAL